MGGSLGVAAGFVCVIACTVGANLLLKVGAMASVDDRIILGLLGWKSAAGLALFGCGGLIYAVLLRAVPLNVAQVFTSLQLLGVILAAYGVLGEPISALRCLGIGCVVLGVAIVGATAMD